MGDLGIGALLPHAGRAASATAIREMSAGAEALGVDSLWCGDHIVLPREQSSQYPYRAEGETGQYEVPAARPFLEAFQSLAFAAACTRRIALGLSVGIVPYRHPLLWAKSIGTLSVLSEGRFIVGLGAGWMEEEFRALDADYTGRGRRTDETLRALRDIWSSDDGTVTVPIGNGPHEGAVHVVPARHQEPPSVWIGGSGSVAVRRTARFGDVWHPHIRGHSPGDIADTLMRIREYAQSEGRTWHGSAALLIPFQLAERPEPLPSGTGRLVGPAGFCSDVLAEYADAGVSHVILASGGRPARRLRQLGELLAAMGR